MKDPGGPQKAPRGTKEAPRRHPGVPKWLPQAPMGSAGGQSCLGENMSQNHRVLLSKVDSPTISPQRGEGDTHDLRSLRTKVDLRQSHVTQERKP